MFGQWRGAAKANRKWKIYFQLQRLQDLPSSYYFSLDSLSKLTSDRSGRTQDRIDIIRTTMPDMATGSNPPPTMLEDLCVQFILTAPDELLK